MTGDLSMARLARHLAQQPGEADSAWEHRLNDHIDEVALELLEYCKRLGWGSGEPLKDALCRIQRVALERGYATPPPPRRVVPSSEKPITRTLQRAVWDRDGWRCVWCGSHQDLTVDHVIPRIMGGPTILGNLQTLCKTDNSTKQGRLTDRDIAWLLDRGITFPTSDLVKSAIAAYTRRG